MNHLKIYEAIIQKAKSENRIKLRKNQEGYIYYDNHHIIPKCLNGSDEQDNRQLLTDKEHYVCHKLLTYIYPHHRGITCAFHRMTYSKNGNHIKTARDYAYAKKLIRNIPISKETKKKMSESGKNRPTASKETREKLSKKSTGRLHTEETKQKMKKPKSEEHIKNIKKNHAHISGEKHGKHGKSNYDIWIEKYGLEEANKKLELYKQVMSLSMQGKTHKEETKIKIRKSSKGKHDNNGVNNPMFGKKHSAKSIEKMRISAKNRRKK
jgi:NUMOD3 motif